MKLHACVRCKFSNAFDPAGPFPMLSGTRLHWSFDCINSPHYDAYGKKSGKNTLIWEVNSNKVWVDGSKDVPFEGCENFKSVDTR